MPKDASQLVSHGGDSLGGAQPSFPSSEAVTQIIFAAPEALSRQSQSHGGTALHVTGFDGDDFAAGDAIVRTKAQPRGEAFGGGKAADKVGAQFSKEHEGGVDLDAGHLGEINTTEAVEFGSGSKGRFVALRFFMLTRRWSQQPMTHSL